MEQMTSICDMVGQIIQKKEEEKQIAKEQAAKDRYWKIPICYDDDEDYTIAITPILRGAAGLEALPMLILSALSDLVRLVENVTRKVWTERFEDDDVDAFDIILYLNAELLCFNMDGEVGGRRRSELGCGS
ncbi:hypothetical protein Tco_0806820 [Tanacetum coccineum]